MNTIKVAEATNTQLDWSNGTPSPTKPRWYIASDSKDIYAWRWWNGKYWSHPARPRMSADEVRKQASKRAKVAGRKRPILWIKAMPSTVKRR